MKRNFLIVILFCFICLIFCPLFNVEAATDEIVIFYTNDIHTHIDNDITYSKLATLKDMYENALLLDAGDHTQGTAYGSIDKGQTIVDLMNLVGYDLATLGNHEFDYDMEGCLQTIKRATFPYVSCNFYHEKNGKNTDTVLEPYYIFEINNLKIAFIGITTPETFTSSTPRYFQDDEGNYIYDIIGGTDGKELYQTVQASIDEVKDKVDFVIALGHLGVDESSNPWRSTDVIENTSGLDAFIDGHSHTKIPMEEVTDKDGHNVVLTQTGEYFNQVGKMVISKDGIKSELLTSEFFTNIEENEEVKALETKLIDNVESQLGQKIGTSKVSLNNYDTNNNRLVRNQETNTGDFVADALYYLFDDMGINVDVAFMNGGGIRNTSLSGDLTYRTCMEIHPYGNVACLITVTGQQILDALEWGAKDLGVSENGGFLQVSGLIYSIDTSVSETIQKDDKNVWVGGPKGSYRVHNVKIYNKETNTWDALDLNARYNLAGYNYILRNLGDGYAMFEGATNVLDYVMEDYMVLANYIKGFENAEVDKNNSPLLKKYSNFLLDYENVSGSNRIIFEIKNVDVEDEMVLKSHTETMIKIMGIVVLLSCTGLLIFGTKKLKNKENQN